VREYTHTQRKGVVQTKRPRRVTKRKEETTERSIAGRKEAESFLRGQSEIPPAIYGICGRSFTAFTRTYCWSVP